MFEQKTFRKLNVNVFKIKKVVDKILKFWYHIITERGKNKVRNSQCNATHRKIPKKVQKPLDKNQKFW